MKNICEPASLFRFVILIAVLGVLICSGCSRAFDSASGIANAGRIPPAALTATYTSQSAWWQPPPGTSWQWQLTGEIDPSLDVSMFDVDLFETPQETIDALHAGGHIVICYFSAGSLEDWRPDAEDFPADVVGKEMEGWEGEKWLDIRRLDVLGKIMEARLDLAVAKNCDGVEPDNVDGFENDTGFLLSAQDQLTYNRWLAFQAHQRGLSVGLKNDILQIPDLVDDFDWALNEECFQYNECDAYDVFIRSGKAVFGVEYTLYVDEFCPQANAKNFDFLKKHLELDAWRIPCR